LDPLNFESVVAPLIACETQSNKGKGVRRGLSTVRDQFSVGLVLNESLTEARVRYVHCNNTRRATTPGFIAAKSSPLATVYCISPHTTLDLR